MSDTATEFLIPRAIKTEQSSPLKARFEYGPLDRGFGHTLGNALRRTLLSSMPGYAITQVNLAGHPHEYALVDGMREDLVDMLLNLKQVAVRLTGGESAELGLKVKGEREVTAKDIELPHNVEIINPDQHIAWLSAEGELDATMVVERGRGYVLNERAAGTWSGDFDPEKIGTLRLDASFSPVRRISYTVEQVRKGKRTDLDLLVMELETNGALTPEDAIARAATILSQHLAPIVEPDAGTGRASDADIPGDIEPVYVEGVESLGLSAQTINSLKKVGVSLVGELVRMSVKDLQNTPYIGATSLTEIQERLMEKNLALETQIANWPIKDEEVK